MNDNVTDYGCITTTDTATTTTNEYYNWKWGIPSVWIEPYYNNKGGDENMRYLYEVILVNPKNDDFYEEKAVARSETSAIMYAYRESPFSEEGSGMKVNFDDLKTSCRVLMEWKKKESLKKAIETIKKAVE